MIEHFFQCPYCWQNISMLLDASISEQTYVEDCEVCCQPVEIYVCFREQKLVQFEVKQV